MSGFFASNATISGSGTFETAEAGAYICRLKEVVVKTQPSFDNPEVMENRFQWTFETKDATDSTGKPYRFSKFTSVKFGNDRSGLTILLDSMMGRRLSDQEFQSLDLEDLKARDWKVMVDEKQKDNGYSTNIVMSVKPVQARTSPAQPRQTLGGMATPQSPSQRRSAPPVDIDTDDLEDPFAEDEGNGPTAAQQGHTRRAA
jgi:hypothetical protein